MHSHLLIPFVLLSLTGCTVLNGAPLPSSFNTSAFAGLAGSADDDYSSANLDLVLDEAGGGEIRFVSCPQVEATDEARIQADQYALFRLLRTNCLALKRYASRRPARISHLPRALTPEIVGDLPADAVPRIANESPALPAGRPLKAVVAVEVIEGLPDGRVRVLTSTDEIFYVPMAQADFDGDGVQDVLLRLDWRTRDAFGKGVDLLQVTRLAPNGVLRVTWRMGEP
jgi:hypothetical protein